MILSIYLLHRLCFIKNMYICGTCNQANNNGKENIIIPLKYLNKIKARYPKIKYKENKAKKIFVVEAFE